MDKIIGEAGVEIDRLFPDILNHNIKAGEPMQTITVDFDIPCSKSCIATLIKAQATLKIIKPEQIKQSMSTQCEVGNQANLDIVKNGYEIGSNDIIYKDKKVLNTHHINKGFQDID